GVLSIFVQEPQFQGQTKDRLNNPELTSQVDSAVRPALEHWLNHNVSTANAIVGRIILAARAREASRAAQAEVTRKSATSNRLNLPGKLSDCTTSDNSTSEIIILADADSDGNHIATLLLTFIYRHLPQLIQNGKVYLAQPPLYRIDIGKETHWALDDAQRDQILKANTKNGRGAPEITRFKGLGEMMPKVLWETTLNPKTRRLLRVEVTDQIVTDRVINELMGKDASARFRFIMDRADEAEELDV